MDYENISINNFDCHSMMSGSNQFMSNNQFEILVSSPEQQSQSSNFGGLSPVMDVKPCGGLSPANLTGSQESNKISAFSSDCYLSDAADTLNNWGAAAYHNSLNNSFDVIPNQFETKQEAVWSSFGETPCGSPQMVHTPNPTPLPECETLPYDEPSLQLMQSLSLYNDTSFSANDYQSLNSSYQDMFNESQPNYLNGYQNNTWHSANSLPQQSQQQTPNFNHQDNNWQTSQNFNTGTTTIDDAADSYLISGTSLSLPLDHNIQLPHLNDVNIEEVIQSTSLMNGSSSTASSLSVPAPTLCVTIDPRLWTRDEIRKWLNWARVEFKLSSINITADMLPSTGTELCSLSKQQLQQRAGEADGEKLARHLDCMLNSQGSSLPEDVPDRDPYEMYSDTCKRLSCPGSGQIQLWQFLLELLSDPKNKHIITWDNNNSEFKILEPDEVARMWGERKTKPNMNYDKLSRALRYYYDRGLMTKVSGKRYAYRACFPALEQLHANQNGTEPRPTPDYALISALSSTPSPTPTWRSSDTPSPRHSFN